jgi:phosphoglycerate dehydrogenase-like enzyme
MAEGKVVLWRSMYHPQGHQMLAEAGLDVVVVDSANADEIKQVVYGARALWVRTPERVTAEILNSGSELVVVSTSGFGTDNIIFRLRRNVASSLSTIRVSAECRSPNTRS